MNNRIVIVIAMMMVLAASQLAPLTREELRCNPNPNHNLNPNPNLNNNLNTYDTLYELTRYNV